VVGDHPCWRAITKAIVWLPLFGTLIKVVVMNRVPDSPPMTRDPDFCVLEIRDGVEG
jgi:hypothetical protein